MEITIDTVKHLMRIFPEHKVLMQDEITNKSLADRIFLVEIPYYGYFVYYTDAKTNDIEFAIQFYYEISDAKMLYEFILSIQKDWKAV